MKNYDGTFFDYTTQVTGHSAKAVTSALFGRLRPASVLDVGCAMGMWLAAWRQAGAAEGFGLDGNYVDRSRLLIDTACFQPAELDQPFDLGRRFDLVQCLEVAEHLPHSRAAGLVDDLTRHADIVLFSAAPPGQGGATHINEQPYGYWRELFAQRGYSLCDGVRPLIGADMKVAWWYRLNMFLFVNEAGAQRLSPDLRATMLPPGVAIPDLSPPIIRLRKLVIRALPYPLREVLARIVARLSA
jgi:SAM-dependent methyltransferase